MGGSPQNLETHQHPTMMIGNLVGLDPLCKAKQPPHQSMGSTSHAKQAASMGVQLHGAGTRGAGPGVQGGQGVLERRAMARESKGEQGEGGEGGQGSRRARQQEGPASLPGPLPLLLLPAHANVLGLGHPFQVPRQEAKLVVAEVASHPGATIRGRVIRRRAMVHPTKQVVNVKRLMGGW